VNDVTIYHNRDCGTSRSALALVRHAPDVQLSLADQSKPCRPSEAVLELLPTGQAAALHR
jgi:hypothetical protein